MAMSAMLSFMLLATGASLRSNQHELLDLMPKPEPDYSSINYGNFTGREGRESKKIDFDDIKALIDYLTREDEFRRGLRTTGVDVMRLVSIYQEVPKANDLKPWIDWFHSEDGGGEKYKQDAIKAALEVLFDGNHSSLEDIKKWSDLFYSYFEDKVGSSKKRKLSYRKKATQRALEVLATEDHPDMETLDAWTKALASKDMLFGDKDEASQYALAALTTKRRRSMITVKTVLWFLKEAAHWHLDPREATKKALEVVLGKPEFRKGELIPFRYGGVKHFSWNKGKGAPEQKPEPEPVEPDEPVEPEPGAEPNVPEGSEVEGEITNS